MKAPNKTYLLPRSTISRRKSVFTGQVAIDSGPLDSGHAVRGVGFYTKELINGIRSLKIKDLKIEAVDFSKADLSDYDLLHFTYFNPFFVSFPKNKSQKWVITIHDLIPLVYPDHYQPGVKGRINFELNKLDIKKSDGILSVSETSKKDIVRFLDISAEKIRVIYEAPREIFRKLEIGNWKLEIRKKYGLPDQFALYIGDVNYNKNIPTLIDACKLGKIALVICGKQAKELDQAGVDLYSMNGPRDWIRFLTGKPHPETAHYEQILNALKSNTDVHKLGFVPDDDLVAIYNLATVYIQPSFYEGFGLPVLEAMACGLPTIISKTNALVEISDGSSLIFEPNDSTDLSEKINSILNNKGMAKQLIGKGSGRVKDFSWVKNSSQTIDFYRNILNLD